MTRHLAYKDRSWAVQPAAEETLQALLGDALNACPAANEYAHRLLQGCGIRLRDILDHIEFQDDELASRISQAGWREIEQGIWTNPNGLFPPFIRRPRGLTIFIKVESVERFLIANGLDVKIEGAANGPARRATVFRCDNVDFDVFERSGYAGYDIPEVGPNSIKTARRHLQAFRSRRRQFDRVEDGLAFTEALIDAAVTDLGQHWACDLWLRAEREYWMLRCAAGRLQKSRQDALGVGWCNIDHHTYDSSRRHYRHTIRLLEKLGYELREMIYAGELAGWGSQILEQPVIGSTIFADVDLAPHELDVDFAHDALPDLSKKCRAGVVSALHGESVLEAGLNHVAFLFDKLTLRAQLEREGVKMMGPFSDFPHLYQELTLGDWVAVDPRRVDALEAEGHVAPDEAEKIRLEGAILTHLENIERNDGFKGFNKPGIDGVLRKIDPRQYEVARPAEIARG